MLRDVVDYTTRRWAERVIGSPLLPNMQLFEWIEAWEKCRFEGEAIGLVHALAEGDLRYNPRAVRWLLGLLDVDFSTMLYAGSGAEQINRIMQAGWRVFLFKTIGQKLYDGQMADNVPMDWCRLFLNDDMILNDILTVLKSRSPYLERHGLVKHIHLFLKVWSDAREAKARLGIRNPDGSRDADAASTLRSVRLACLPKIYELCFLCGLDGYVNDDSPRSLTALREMIRPSGGTYSRDLGLDEAVVSGDVVRMRAAEKMLVFEARYRGRKSLPQD